MKKDPIIRRITERAGLHAEAVPGIPFAELCGDDRILIENHKKVIAYSDCLIDVQMSYGILCVTGANMDLACISADRLVIRGKIEGLRIVRGKRC